MVQIAMYHIFIETVLRNIPFVTQIPFATNIPLRSILKSMMSNQLHNGYRNGTFPH